VAAWGARVAEAGLRLGVHAAITVPGSPVRFRRSTCRGTPILPCNGVRARLATPLVRDGFELLVGGSSVGKTRARPKRSRHCWRTGD
jgi:hypothetical protein